MTRTLPCTICSQEMERPATSALSSPLGTRQRYGNAVGFALAVMHAARLPILELRSDFFLGPVDVDEIGVTADFIREGTALEVIVEREFILADDAPRFADAHEGAGHNEVRIAESLGVKLGQRGAILLGHFSALDQRGGDGLGLCVIDIPKMTGIEADGPWTDDNAAKMRVGDQRIPARFDDRVHGAIGVAAGTWRGHAGRHIRRRWSG